MDMLLSLCPIGLQLNIYNHYCMHLFYNKYVKSEQKKPKQHKGNYRNLVAGKQRSLRL